MRRTLVESLESRFLLSAAQLIRNGGFEGAVSSSDWARSGLFQADSRFTNFHSGAGYAYLSDLNGNSANSITGTMYQQLTVPATASSLTLSFWTKFTTSETTTTAANDVFNVQVMDSTGTNVLQSLPGAVQSERVQLVRSANVLPSRALDRADGAAGLLRQHERDAADDVPRG